MDKEDKQIFHLRKTCGLPALVAKPRRCLQCCEMFDSAGSHNRVCNVCKSTRVRSVVSASILQGLAKSEPCKHTEGEM